MTDLIDIGITACSKSKQGGPESDQLFEARKLYDSWLFDGRAEALKANCNDWFIFSGKHGYLHPKDEIQWYNQRLDDHPPEKQRELAMDVAEHIAETDATSVMILMGRTYAKPLKDALNEDITVHDPLEGVQLFDQRSELDKLADTSDHHQTTL